ncbi:MAG: hypothetical protein J6B57_03930 [Oscillospiraceae bacterium]|nr:hypothetical protein [Oscillospiraceae bacterium]
MAKTECVNYNHGKDRCNLLMELVCEQKCRCSFFCTYEQQEASMKNHDRILRNKPEDIQNRAALLYYGGRKPWNT